MSNLFDLIVQKKSPALSEDDKGGGGEPPSSVTNHEKPNEALDQQPDHSPQLMHISPSKHDRILEVDSLRAFTIPKARKQKPLLEEISLESREYRDIHAIINKSFKDRNAEQSFHYFSCSLVHSPHYEKFVEKRKEMRANGYSEKELQESYGFLYCTDSEVVPTCTQSVKMGNTQSKVLGIPEMGVYLSKHADIISQYPFVRNHHGRVIIFKIMKGRVKTMAENYGDTALDPTPSFDCHISKNASFDLAAVSHQGAFESSQIYVYEYDDMCDLVEYPRQICPYAVLKFIHKGEGKRHKLQAHKASVRSPAASSPLPASSTLRQDPMRVNPPSWRQGAHKLTPNPQSPQPQITPGRPSQGLLPTPGAAASWQPPPSPSTSRSVPSQSPPPTPAAPSPQSLPSTPSSPASFPMAAPSPLAAENITIVNPPTGRGRPAPGGGLVVWSGQLASSGINLCMADLISHGSTPLKPARIGPVLNITSRVPLQYILTNYLPNLSSVLHKEKETRNGARYYNYCELRPSAQQQHDPRFQQMVAYLLRNNSAATVKLDESDVLLLPNCPTTLELGLGDGVPQPDLMHCVFVSSSSRYAIRKIKRPLLPLKPPVSPASSGAPSPQSMVGSPLTPQPSFTPPSGTPSPAPAGGVAPVNKETLTQLFGVHNDLENQKKQENKGKSKHKKRRKSGGDVDMRGGGFKEPHPPGRHAETECPFDEGFQRYVPPESLLNRETLIKAFANQVVLQDRKNIEVARKQLANQGQVSSQVPPQPAPQHLQQVPSPYSVNNSNSNLSNQPSPVASIPSPASSITSKDTRDPRLRRQGATSRQSSSSSSPGIVTPPIPPPFGSTLPIPPNVELHNFLDSPPTVTSSGGVGNRVNYPAGYPAPPPAPPLSQRLPPPNFLVPPTLLGQQTTNIHPNHCSVQPQQSVRPPELVQPAYSPATTTYFNATTTATTALPMNTINTVSYQDQNLSKSLSVGITPPSITSMTTTTTSTLPTTTSSSNTSTLTSALSTTLTSGGAKVMTASYGVEVGSIPLPPLPPLPLSPPPPPPPPATSTSHPTEGLIPTTPPTTTTTSTHSSAVFAPVLPVPNINQTLSAQIEQLKAIVATVNLQKTQTSQKSPNTAGEEAQFSPTASPPPPRAFSPPSPSLSPPSSPRVDYVPTPITNTTLKADNDGSEKEEEKHGEEEEEEKQEEAEEEEQEEEEDENDEDLILNIVKNQPLALKAERLKKEKEKEKTKSAGVISSADAMKKFLNLSSPVKKKSRKKTKRMSVALGKRVGLEKSVTLSPGGRHILKRSPTKHPEKPRTDLAQEEIENTEKESLEVEETPQKDLGYKKIEKPEKKCLQVDKRLNNNLGEEKIEKDVKDKVILKFNEEDEQDLAQGKREGKEITLKSTEKNKQLKVQKDLAQQKAEKDSTLNNEQSKVKLPDKQREKVKKLFKETKAKPKQPPSLTDVSNRKTPDPRKVSDSSNLDNGKSEQSDKPKSPGSLDFLNTQNDGVKPFRIPKKRKSTEDAGNSTEQKKSPCRPHSVLQSPPKAPLVYGNTPANKQPRLGNLQNSKKKTPPKPTVKSTVKLDDVVEDFEFDFVEIQKIPTEIPLDPEIPPSIPLDPQPENHTGSKSDTTQTRNRSNSRESLKGNCIPTLIDGMIHKRSPSKRVPSTETRIIPTEIPKPKPCPIPTIGSTRGALIPIIPMETEPLEFDFSDAGSLSSSHDGSRDTSRQQSPLPLRNSSNSMRVKPPSTPPMRRKNNNPPPPKSTLGTPIKFTHILDVAAPDNVWMSHKQFITANILPVLQSDNPMSELDSNVDVFPHAKITAGDALEDIVVTFKVDPEDMTSETDASDDDLLMDSVHHVLFSNYDDSDDEEEGEEARMRAQIVSLSLHYLLAIMEIMEEDRTVNDKGSNKVKTDGGMKQVNKHDSNNNTLPVDSASTTDIPTTKSASVPEPTAVSLLLSMSNSTQMHKVPPLHSSPVPLVPISTSSVCASAVSMLDSVPMSIAPSTSVSDSASVSVAPATSVPSSTPCEPDSSTLNKTSEPGVATDAGSICTPTKATDLASMSPKSLSKAVSMIMSVATQSKPLESGIPETNSTPKTSAISLLNIFNKSGSKSTSSPPKSTLISSETKSSKDLPSTNTKSSPVPSPPVFSSDTTPANAGHKEPSHTTVYSEAPPTSCPLSAPVMSPASQAPPTRVMNAPSVSSPVSLVLDLAKCSKQANILAINEEPEKDTNMHSQIDAEDLDFEIPVMLPPSTKPHSLTSQAHSEAGENQGNTEDVQFVSPADDIRISMTGNDTRKVELATGMPGMTRLKDGPPANILVSQASEETIKIEERIQSISTDIDLMVGELNRSREEPVRSSPGTPLLDETKPSPHPGLEKSREEIKKLGKLADNLIPQKTDKPKMHVSRPLTANLFSRAMKDIASQKSRIKFKPDERECKELNPEQTGESPPDVAVTSVWENAEEYALREQALKSLPNQKAQEKMLREEALKSMSDHHSHSPKERTWKSVLNVAKQDQKPRAYSKDEKSKPQSMPREDGIRSKIDDRSRSHSRVPDRTGSRGSDSRKRSRSRSRSRSCRHSHSKSTTPSSVVHSRSVSRSPSRSRAHRSRSRSRVSKVRKRSRSRSKARGSRHRSSSRSRSRPERHEGGGKAKKDDARSMRYHPYRKQLQPVAFKAYEASQGLHKCTTKEIYREKRGKFDKAINELRDEIVRLWRGEKAAKGRFEGYTFTRSKNIDEEKAFTHHDDLEDRYWQLEDKDKQELEQRCQQDEQQQHSSADKQR